MDQDKLHEGFMMGDIEIIVPRQLIIDLCLLVLNSSMLRQLNVAILNRYYIVNRRVVYSHHNVRDL